jgi:hypothetical protein
MRSPVTDTPEPTPKKRGLLAGLTREQQREWRRANLAQARQRTKDRKREKRASQIRRSIEAHEVSLQPETVPGRILSDFRTALTDDQGGPDNLTAARRMLIDTVAMSGLILKVLDGWILRAYTTGSGAVAPDDLPVLAERRALAGLLGSQLKLLGLSRQAKSVETLDQYLERTAEEREARQREQEQLEQTPDQEQTRIEES